MIHNRCCAKERGETACARRGMSCAWAEALKPPRRRFSSNARFEADGSGNCDEMPSWVIMLLASGGELRAIGEPSRLLFGQLADLPDQNTFDYICQTGNGGPVEEMMHRQLDLGDFAQAGDDLDGHQRMPAQFKKVVV